MLGLSALFLFIFIQWLSDLIFINPLTGEFVGSVKFDKAAYGQTVGQVAISLLDSGINICMALVLVIGFTFSLSKNFHDHKILNLMTICAFSVSNVISIFSALKFKSGLLIQIQYDSIDIERLEPIFSTHLASMLIAGLSTFFFFIVNIGLISRTGDAP